MTPSLMSSFLAFELEPAEEVQAYTFSALQAIGIKNLIAAAAEEIVAIQLSADEFTTEMLKRRSYLQGQVAILKHLLERHDEISSRTN
ncbi:hypothetical protein D3C78_1116680 [compost metagenome]